MLQKLLFGIAGLLVCINTVWAATADELITQEVKTWSQTNLGLTDAEFNIQYLSDLPAWLTGKTIKAIQILPSTAPKYMGITHVKMRILTEDKKERIWEASFKIQVFVNVMAAARNLAKHETLNNQDVTRVKTDITYLEHESFFTSFNEIKGYRASQYIPKNAPLTSVKTEKIPIMKKDAMVIVYARCGGISVEYGGITDQEGNVGDLVRIINPSTKKEFMARILDDSHVEVIL